MTEQKSLSETICNIGFWYDREAEKLAGEPLSSQRWQGLRVGLLFALCDLYNEIVAEIATNNNMEGK